MLGLGEVLCLFGTLSERTIFRARPGVGSFLSIDLKCDHDEVLWLQNAAWRIVGSEGVIAGSYDEPDGLARGADSLKGAVIQTASVEEFCDLTLMLSNGMSVKTFTTAGSPGLTLWSLLLEHEVISGVSGSSFEIETRPS
jgi:hypothetical protein